MSKTAAGIKRLASIASGSASRLKGIWNPLWSILTFSVADERIAPRKGICVSIERGGASLAYGSRFLSRIKLKAFQEYTFGEQGYPQPEDVASSVALTLGNLRASKTGITLSIPKTWAIVSTAELPSVVKENLSGVISCELDRFTPLSSEDAYFDFSILGETDGKLSPVIVAAKADTVIPYIQALQEKGLSVERVALNLSGIGALLRHMGGEKETIFLDVRDQGFEASLFHDGTVAEAFSERFTSGDDKGRADAVMAGIESLKNRSLMQGKTPRTALLFRESGATVKELIKLHSPPPLTILDEVDLRINLPAPRRDLSYASAGGVLESLAPKAKGLNLLSKGRHEIPPRPIGLTIVLLIALIAALVVYLLIPFQIEGKRLNEIDRQILLKKDAVRKVEDLKKEIEALSIDLSAIRQFKETKAMSLNILKELTTILPKTTWLTRVRTTETTVEIEGYASSATEMLPKLEASKLFRKAEFASPTFRDARMNADRFIIKMEIEGAQKPEEEAGKSAKK